MSALSNASLHLNARDVAVRLAAHLDYHILELRSGEHGSALTLFVDGTLAQRERFVALLRDRAEEILPSAPAST